MKVGLLTAAMSCGGDEATTTPTRVSVASIAITASAPAIELNTTMQLTATLKDAVGNTLSGRSVSWTSSNPAVATVSSQGLVTGAGTGTSTITATSEYMTGTTQVTVLAPPIVTGISDPISFVSRCPTSDPAYDAIRRDFELRSDGLLITATPTCTEPYTTMQLTDELLALQTLRTVYYMSKGTAGKLPWTPLALYEWVKSEVAGIDLQTQLSSGTGDWERTVTSCCEIINGRKYVTTARQSAEGLAFLRNWYWTAEWVTMFAHVARHADGPAHVHGCPIFPLATDPLACDLTYDPAQMSSFGIQYWLYAAWGTGLLNVGIACLPPDTARAYAMQAFAISASLPPRFVNNAPPAPAVTPPYGGLCHAP